MRLAGVCGLTFGWSPERFWAATPAELVALVAAAAPAGAVPATRVDVERMERGDG